jgi:broad specificity phosphatase PhoE
MMSEKSEYVMNYNGEPLEVNLPSRIAIVRHLHSYYNEQRKKSKKKPDAINQFLGKSHLDWSIPLSDLGLIQGGLLQDIWNNINSNHCYNNYISSPYLRTQLTTQFLSSSYTTDNNLIERSAGGFYGMTREQKQEKYPNIIEQSKNRWEFSLEGCENYQDLTDRAILALVELRGNSTVITHGEMVTALRCLIEAPIGTDVNTFVKSMGLNYASNGSILEYDFSKPKLIYKRLSTINKKNTAYNIGQWQPILK